MLKSTRTRIGIDGKTLLSIKVKMNGLTISREINQVKNVKSYSEWNTLWQWNILKFNHMKICSDWDLSKGFFGEGSSLQFSFSYILNKIYFLIDDKTLLYTNYHSKYSENFLRNSSSKYAHRENISISKSLKL